MGKPVQAPAAESAGPVTTVGPGGGRPAPPGPPPPVTAPVGAVSAPVSAPVSAAGAVTETQAAFAEVLAGILKTDQVPADGHFFHDLGADSLLMAQFCARVRKRPGLPTVSIKDVYQHPSLALLAAAVAPAHPAAGLDGTTVPAPGPAVPVPADAAPVPREQLPHPAHGPHPGDQPDPAEEPITRRRDHLICGSLQLLMFLGYSYLTGLVIWVGYEWISGTTDPVQNYLRAVVIGAATFLGMCLLPIAAKWALIGRWTPRTIRIWSLDYVRFWLVKTLIRANPVALFFTGTPLYPLYLRALGARVGAGVAIFSRTVPICTDQLTVGAGTVIGKESSFLCYRAHRGRIEIGPVTLGENAFVGEKTVLEIGSSIGDGAQLGHTSSLPAGARVPAGERWHGSPAVPTTVAYARIPPARIGRLRQVSYSTFALLRWFLLYLPVVEGGLYALLVKIPAFSRLLGPGLDSVTTVTFYRDAALLSVAVYLGALVFGLLSVGILPRLLTRLLTPDRVYPLYGFHYGVQRAIERISNRRFFMLLFGDSCSVIGYLRWTGYRFGPVEQTGSNFGMELTHDNPVLTTIGSGTMVADALFVVNVDLSSTSFRVGRVSIGAHNFLGNHIAYPAGARTGDNCLLATKVMVPIEGPVREGVGLLGSPSFEIPRSVARDGQFDHLATGDERCRRLARKRRYDLRTMGVFLAVRWLHLFLLTTLGLAAVDLSGRFEDLVMAGFLALGLVITTGYFVAVERVMLRFGRLRPQYCSVYEPYFWWHERLWKVPSDTHVRALDGTPFKALVWRALGARIGPRVFDDGCSITERTLAQVGEDTTLNHGSKIQCHSQEDGTFKSDRITVGAGCTLGVGALVHYGATVGDHAVIAPDSFLMKGEEVPPRAQWGGNPAREITT